MKITKRDGRIVEHDPNAITRACYKAGVSEQICKRVSLEVTPYIEEGHHVEHIQDMVELSLMRHAPDIARKYILYREEHNKARGVEPDPSAISDYILHSKYAQSGESWEDVVWRNCRMHTSRYSHIGASIEKVYEKFVLPKKVLPSMRSLQYAGAPILQHNARMYNCSFSHCNRLEFFSELFYLLLAGCGVGYSVQRRHTDKLPEFPKVSRKKVYHHRVEDTIEGWGEAVRWLLVGAADGNFVEFIYGNIRDEGSPISSGGVAPGHVPLKECLETIRERLVGKLRPIDWHDICCILAIAVLSGGIRRSSLLSLFDNDDHEMIHAKTGDWYERYPFRAMANNSAVFLRSDGSPSPFYRLFDRVREFGEPGIFFTDDADYGTNPCGEIGLEPPAKGFQFCNLTEINGSTVKSKEDFIERARVGAFIGTLQAGYTDFPYLHESTAERCRRDALLGVSITGIMDNKIVWDPSNQHDAALAAVEENRRVSDLIGIRYAKRVTTVKPSGTASLLLGGVGSGIHPHHSRRYFRRVTANANEPVFREFRRLNAHMCEEKPNGDWIICFPVLTEGITQDEIEDCDFMDLVLSTYQNWITGGSVGDLTHNVSSTVTVTNWDAVADKLWENRERVQAMSFLPRDDKKYPYMPRQRIATSVEFAAWKALVENYREVKYESGVSDYGSGCESEKCDLRSK